MIETELTEPVYENDAFVFFPTNAATTPTNTTDEYSTFKMLILGNASYCLQEQNVCKNYIIQCI